MLHRMQIELSPDEVAQLVGLRAMLEHAVRFASSAPAVHQTTAVVLLDAVVERVTFLTAVSLGLSIGPRDGQKSCARR